ncbi:MAG TPA: LamG-like jellyroll fold domain-containing protein [Candidatus Acidoferrum sp.]|nr:LamG-like jellyroll fold domain-containing protein [Candidatus Acidoferrum sp.]
MKTKTIKQLGYACAAISALCFGQYVSAQDSHWNGTVGNTLWNVATNWNPVGVPPPGNPTTTYSGNVWLDPSPVDGDTVITIPMGDVETPGVGNSSEVYNTIFGPEFGCTLNVYGTLAWDWTLAPYQPDPTPGKRSKINMFGNANMHTSGASMNLGSGWWPICEGTYCTMNLYDNSTYSSLGGAGLWSGGHINIYDNSSFLVNGYVNLNNGQANNDGTTDFVVGGGKLTLPEGFMTSTVTNWIQRGILRAYGKGYDTNDFVITDDGTNTYVTAVPLGGALQRIYFQPLVISNTAVGTFQQLTLVGDYPSVGGVLLSSAEPGLDPATFAAPVYSSSNPNVVTVDTNGLVTAVHAGTAQLTAKVGVLNSTNSVTITVTPVVPGLAHRYTFSAASGSTVPDSVGGANGTLMGGYTLSGGQINLDGSSGYVQLPAGILSSVNEVTIETWVTFGAPINTWADLFAFGNSELAGNGENYISMQPHTGGGTASLNFGQGDPGNSGERDAAINNTLDGQANMHVVVVYHPLAGYEAYYTNGVFAASVSMFNVLMDPVASVDPAFNNGSILSYTLGSDPINYIGHSLYSADPTLNASIQEFRVYTNAITASQIAADYALGPNQLLGTSVNTSLSASASGGNVTIKWPTTSALVTLLSSPTLGNAAVWTPVSAPLTVVGGNYQVTVPASSGMLFFRLQQ